MTNLSRNKLFWQWIVIVCYAGFLAYLGLIFLNRSAPDLFFGVLIGATAVLMLALRFIESKTAKPNKQ